MDAGMDSPKSLRDQTTATVEQQVKVTDITLSMLKVSLGEGNLKSEAKPRILTPHPN